MMFFGWQLGAQAFGLAFSTFISFIMVGFTYSREWVFGTPIKDNLWMQVGELYLLTAVVMTALGFVGWICYGSEAAKKALKKGELK